MMHRAPFRVFVTVRATSDHYPEAWVAPEKIVQLALAALPPEASVDQAEASLAQVIAITRTDSKTRIVFDMFHDEYDPMKGHLKSEGNLPVWVIDSGKKNNEEMVNALPATSIVQQQVNHAVRAIHGLNALEALPPFKEDYANNHTPLTINPRCPRGTTN